MTKNEVREMYGLPPIEEEVKPIVSSAIHRFDDTCEHAFTSESEVDEIIDVFILFGDDVTNYEIVEEDINKEFSFAEVTPLSTVLKRDIIALLEKDPLLDDKTIADTLRVKEDRVRDIMDTLVKDKQINVKEKNIGGQKKAIRVPTRDAMTNYGRTQNAIVSVYG